MEVTQEQYTTLFIRADTREEAEEDAHELAASLHLKREWDTDDLDVHVTPAWSPPENGLYWSGGPDGEMSRWRA